MLAGDFAHKIKQLNPRLKIACGDDDSRPASLFFVDRLGEEEAICGIDKNIVPEWPVFNANGSIKKAGWRRTLRILIGRGLVDRFEAQKLFKADLNFKRPKEVKKQQTLVNKLAEKGLAVKDQGGSLYA